MSRKVPKNSFFLTPRLNILGKGDDQKDKVIFPNAEPADEHVEYSKALVASLPLDIKTRRDLAIDYMNPREELPKYIKSVDENPAFDLSSLTLITNSDELAKQTVSLIQSGRASFIKEENKYNSVMPENASAVAEGAPSYSELRSLIETNVAMQHQSSIDQTSSL